MEGFVFNEFIGWRDLFKQIKEWRDWVGFKLNSSPINKWWIRTFITWKTKKISLPLFPQNPTATLPHLLQFFFSIFLDSRELRWVMVKMEPHNHGREVWLHMHWSFILPPNLNSCMPKEKNACMWVLVCVLVLWSWCMCFALVWFGCMLDFLY